MKHIITEKMVEEYREYLIEEEKSIATIKKYISDIRKLMIYAKGREITKKLMVCYKEDLRLNKRYKLSSINSFIIAANRLFEYLEWYGLSVKTYHIQKDAYVSEKKDLSVNEYRKLVNAARRKGKKRLTMIIQTLCSTGIRISELAFLTVESVRKGEIEIYCKKKQRKALIPEGLKKLLINYIKENKIKSGFVFCTSRGNDIAKLADVLGHSSIETTRISIFSIKFLYKFAVGRIETRQIKRNDIKDCEFKECCVYRCNTFI